MVDYLFYTTVYLGSAIGEKAFPQLAARAQAELDRLKRMYRVVSPGEDSEKFALCAVAEALQTLQKRGNARSATVGGVSITYDDGSCDAAVYRAAAVYLDIYRGVCR